jgi:hypothetical protein
MNCAICDAIVYTGVQGTIVAGYVVCYKCIQNLVLDNLGVIANEGGDVE